MRHILVIRLSALGDVAILAPLMRVVSVANPDTKFTIAAPPLLEPLFEGMPNVEFRGIDKKQSAKEIYKKLKDIGADTVADLHKVNKVGWAVMMLQAHELLHLNLKFRIHTLHKGRWSRFLMTHQLSDKPRRPQHLRYADVFRRTGLTVPTDTLESPFKVQKKSSGDVTIGIAPFSQHAQKTWPFAYMEHLVQMLTKRGYRIMLFASKSEAAQIACWEQYPGVVSTAGKYSFSQELELISQLSLMVSMDSSNMHFASAMGVPVVSIWGGTHPDLGFYGYRQERSNALCANMKCQPCSAYGSKPCKYGDLRCLYAVKPEEVLAKIESLLN